MVATEWHSWVYVYKIPINYSYTTTCYRAYFDVSRWHAAVWSFLSGQYERSSISFLDPFSSSKYCQFRTVFGSLEIATISDTVLATFSELWVASRPQFCRPLVPLWSFINNLKRLQNFVTSPADHYPSSLTIHCPCQWHDLVCRTFLDPHVFTACTSNPVQTLYQIQESVPDWISRDYAWGLDFSSALSSGYILPKPSRNYEKARPIINYSRAWPRKLGQALGIALLEILQIVYADLLQLKDVQAVVMAIRRFFDLGQSDDITFELYQTDIAGFYNQVEHNRILTAVQFAVHLFCDLQPVSLDSSVQTHTNKMERTLRLFRGHWRSQSKQYRSIKLCDISPLVEFLLQNSFFHVGTQVFRQHRGASMGSQWAPILCSAVALMREYTFHSVFSQMISQPHFAHRYVDNRIMVLPANYVTRNPVRLFWRLGFYTAPILLEEVSGLEVLGFTIDPHQQSVTFIQPWNKTMRSVNSSGPSRALKAGILARLRLILNNVWPVTARYAQIQDFIGLMASKCPILFQSANFKCEIVHLCRKYRCSLTQDQILAFLWKRCRQLLPHVGAVVCVCVNRYNKRSIFRLLVTNQFAGGCWGSLWSASNEDTTMFLWYGNGTLFPRTCHWTFVQAVTIRLFQVIQVDRHRFCSLHLYNLPLKAT